MLPVPAEPVRALAGVVRVPVDAGAPVGARVSPLRAERDARLAVSPGVALGAPAAVLLHPVHAGGAVLALVARAVVDVLLAAGAAEPGQADAPVAEQIFIFLKKLLFSSRVMSQT